MALVFTSDRGAAPRDRRGTYHHAHADLVTAWSDEPNDLVSACYDCGDQVITYPGW